jgi:hypothetical protein
MIMTKTAAKTTAPDNAKPAQKDAIALLKADHEAVSQRRLRAQGLRPLRRYLVLTWHGEVRLARGPDPV